MRHMGISSVRAKALSPAVRQLLQQPAAISAIASFGIHALVFALLPILPYAALVEEKEPEIRQSVDVVELSPEEQARLPEFPASQIDLPPLLDSLPPAVTDLPPLPVPSQSTAPPSADDLFSDPFFSSSLPNFSIPTFPQTVPYPPAPPVQSRPQQPVTVQPQTETPTASPSPAPEGLPILPGGSELLNPQPQESNNPQTQQNSQTAANSQATPSPTPSPSVQPRSDEEIVAALRRDVEARRQQIAIQEQLAYNPSGTDADPNHNTDRSWVAWVDSLQAEGVNLENLSNRAVDNIEAPFPPEACEVVQKEVSADVGVVVDPDGKAIGTPAIVRNSGYEFFNLKAGEAALSHVGYKNDTGKNLPYLVTVTFPYTGDSCSGTAGQPTASPAP